MEVIAEGTGPRAVVMIHGWPDTYRLWDKQVEALKASYRCVRFTLPGFERTDDARAYALDEVIEVIRTVVERACPGERVTLLLHDWGCFYGYQFAMKYPQLVERVVGVDIGDAGSRQNRAELGAKGKAMVIAYQLWLALAWRIGGRIGDAMARWMARTMRCPTDQRTIGAHMGYPYAVRWLGVAGGVGRMKAFKPHCPMLFMYAERKPVMFHSREWAERIATTHGNRVVSFNTGHWIMVQQAGAFNAALRTWLCETEKPA